MYKRIIALIGTLAVTLMLLPTTALASHTTSTQAKGGINTHLSYFNTVYADADLAAKAVNVSEARFARDSINPYQGTGYYDRMYTAFRKVNAASGARFLGLVVRADLSVKDQLDVLAPMVAEGVVIAVEGANEWDNKGRTNWLAEVQAHQCELYKQVKARWPKMEVLGPSFVYKQSMRDIGSSIAHCMDLSNLHYYARQTGIDTRDLDERIRLAREVVGGGKQLIVTEANGIYGDPFGGTEQGQADYAKVLFDLLGDRGVYRIFTYELYNDSRPSKPATHSENNYGIYRVQDGKAYAKPVFFPVRDVNRRG